jgi:hypothetical protein
MHCGDIALVGCATETGFNGRVYEAFVLYISSLTMETYFDPTKSEKDFCSTNFSRVRDAFANRRDGRNPFLVRIQQYGAGSFKENPMDIDVDPASPCQNDESKLLPERLIKTECTSSETSNSSAPGSHTSENMQQEIKLPNIVPESEPTRRRKKKKNLA